MSWRRPCQQVRQRLCLLILEHTYLRPDRLGKGGQDQGVDLVGLGETSASFGVVTHLTRIDHRYGQSCNRQGTGELGLKAARRFHHDQRGPERSPALTQTDDVESATSTRMIFPSAKPLRPSSGTFQLTSCEGTANGRSNR